MNTILRQGLKRKVDYFVNEICNFIHIASGSVVL